MQNLVLRTIAWIEARKQDEQGQGLVERLDCFFGAPESTEDRSTPR